MGALFLALSGELWLERTSEERGESLLVWDKEGFIEHIANCFEFFDYWTRDPVVMYGMKAVDFILTLSGIEVRTMESVDGQCTNVFVGPLVDRRVARLNTGFRCYPQGGNKWKGRLVDVRPGKNRVWLVMCPSKCWKDIEIDDSVLTQGVLQVELNEQDVHGNEDWPESM